MPTNCQKFAFKIIWSLSLAITQINIIKIIVFFGTLLLQYRKLRHFLIFFVIAETLRVVATGFDFFVSIFFRFFFSFFRLPPDRYDSYCEKTVTIWRIFDFSSVFSWQCWKIAQKIAKSNDLVVGTVSIFGYTGLRPKPYFGFLDLSATKWATCLYFLSCKLGIR